VFWKSEELWLFTKFKKKEIKNPLYVLKLDFQVQKMQK
jgi:hypothetical protein